MKIATFHGTWQALVKAGDIQLKNQGYLFPPLACYFARLNFGHKPSPKVKNFYLPSSSGWLLHRYYPQLVGVGSETGLRTKFPIWSDNAWLGSRKYTPWLRQKPLIKVTNYSVSSNSRLGVLFEERKLEGIKTQIVPKYRGIQGGLWLLYYS